MKLLLKQETIKKIIPKKKISKVNITTLKILF